MSTTLIIVILAAGIVFLLSMVFKKNAKIKELEAQVDHAKKEMQGVTDVIKEIKRAETGTDKPAEVPPASTGDSAARLDRLNKL